MAGLKIKLAQENPEKRQKIEDKWDFLNMDGIDKTLFTTEIDENLWSSGQQD